MSWGRTPVRRKIMNTNDRIEGVLAISTLVLCIASWCFPWSNLRSPSKRVVLQLPLLAFALYGLYELLMPIEMNIRVDLLLLWPVLLITLGLYLIRMLRAFRRRA